MLTLRLAFRNIIGAGLRTWLSVIVLSFTFVIIIWQLGLVEGWHQQALTDLIDWEIGGGQYWAKNFDPYDTFSFKDGRAIIPDKFLEKSNARNALPILVSPATIYPNGRIQNTILKGIAPKQTVLKLPTACLETDTSLIPVLLGTGMAKENRLKPGDSFTIRWRNAQGAYDASDALVVGVMKTKNPAVDQGQLWIPIKRLQEMLQLPGQASYITIGTNMENPGHIEGWKFYDQTALSQDITDLVMMEKIGDSVFFAILLLLALLAVFDTQVLAIFSRRKEIGTLIALGMTRNDVIRLFTVEGAMHGILSLLFGTIWGVPLLAYTQNTGIGMPEGIESMGMSVPDIIYPIYSAELIIAATLIILFSVTIVSYFPARQIAQLNPADAIRGKISQVANHI